ncbi:hypothetical protein NG798_00865 [Ancylothrix sp. C2]|uniref:hypothetical protein n=1 Tax=Ancylothrix sp. D3o TaxID=2953691 RepID=UPI0021BA5288|nr:hypothetical protein [Ancylothrix sp. D3o]MCT7948344.1 hypothetical protein [Ancylothrix sp. D3o]
MTTTVAVRPADLRHLGQQLEERLQLKLFPNGPMQVRCARRSETLMVLGQHSELVMPDTQQIFSILEQAITALHPDWVEKVQLFLQVTEKKQPYATHSFSIAAPTITGVPPVPLVSKEEMPPLSEVATAEFSPEEPILTAENRAKVTADVADPWETKEATSTPEPEMMTEEVPVSKPVDEVPRKDNVWLPATVMGAGVSLVVLLGIVYPLTRPCVIGKCVELATAKELGQESVKILEGAKTAAAPIQAKSKLREAEEVLKTIPFWSFYYQEAQSLIQTYQNRAGVFDDLLEIQKSATLASQKSQNPPHSLGTWQEIQSLWRSAIAKLEKLPADSQIDGWREEKIKEYQKNVEVVNKRIQSEQKAENQLRAAISAGQIAEARQGVAQSLEGWQQVHATWQTAIKALQQVPVGTMAHREAQQIMQNYQPKLLETQARKITEEKAAAVYNQSLRLAENAQRSEEKNQWTQAVSLWRQAIVNTEKVPVGTDYYEQSLPLKEAYNSSLERAQAKLQVAVTLQKVRQDLRTTCAGRLKVCDYAVTGDRITVYISPEYQKAIRQAATIADRKNDSKTRATVDSRVQKLQSTLETISNRAGIPVQVYDSTGGVIGSYTPRPRT